MSWDGAFLIVAGLRVWQTNLEECGSTRRLNLSRGIETGEFAAQAVDAFKTALAERLVAVVLFGSRARGEASEASDWDFLVIAELLPSGVLDRNLHLKHSLPPECRGRVSILAKTPDQLSGSISSVFLDIALDGQILYDPRGFAEERLRSVRRRITQLGLRRERTPEGFDWRWERPPAGPWSLSWSA